MIEERQKVPSSGSIFSKSIPMMEGGVVFFAFVSRAWHQLPGAQPTSMIVEFGLIILYFYIYL